MAEERLPGIAVECDQAGRIVRIIRDELGIATAVSTGQLLTKLIYPEAAAKVCAFLEAIREQQAAFDWELTVPMGGHPTVLHFSGAIADNGAIVAVGSTGGAAARNNHLYDELTRLNNELGSLQRELTKKNITLERLNQEKNEFLGIAAHDLRNPLGVIANYSDWLLNEAGDTIRAEHRQLLDRIKSLSAFMLHLVGDLLDISKIEAGAIGIARQTTDLSRLIERVVLLNRPIAQRKQIALRFTHHVSAPVLVMVDPEKIDQLLTNLIVNAIKFSQPQTMVSVQLDVLESAAMISVHDEGPGIPAHERDKLFKPFQQTSVRSTAGEEGSGLGLAIVRRIAENHGGKVWVESQIGTGSTFYVSLPTDA